MSDRPNDERTIARALLAPRASARRVQGFTLIELIVVIGLVAVLLGMGVGLVARIKVGDRAAVGIVENVLRSAHNSAVAGDAGARVVIDVPGRALQAFGLKVVGTWHFEDVPIRGAFGVEGATLGGELVPSGFTGRALSFVGQPSRSHVEIPVQLDPAFDLGRGFGLSCAVRTSTSDGGDLLTIGESMGLSTIDDGGLRAWFAPEIVEEDGERRRGSRVVLATETGLLRPGHWSQVEVQYDRATLSVLVDGALVAHLAETAPVWKVEGPLVLSPSGTPFPGAIDALVVSAVAGEDRRELPQGVGFDATGPKQIVFAAGGVLDRSVHREPVRLGLKFDDGREARILVNLHGTVE
jgi:prepilin-type N-terminal cleavage/methylation domain-containing protein